MKCILCKNEVKKHEYGLCIECFTNLIVTNTIFNKGFISKLVNDEVNIVKKFLICISSVLLIANILLILYAAQGVDEYFVLIIGISVIINIILGIITFNYFSNLPKIIIKTRRKILSGGIITYPSIFSIMDETKKIVNEYNGDIKDASEHELKILAKNHNLNDINIIKDYITYYNYVDKIIKMKSKNIVRTEEEIEQYYELNEDLKWFTSRLIKYDIVDVISQQYKNDCIVNIPKNYIVDEIEVNKYFNDIKIGEKIIKKLPYGNIKFILKLSVPFNKSIIIDGYIKIKLYENNIKIGDGILKGIIQEKVIEKEKKVYCSNKIIDKKYKIIDNYLRGFNNKDKYEVLIKVNKKKIENLENLVIKLEPIQLWGCIMK